MKLFFLRQLAGLLLSYIMRNGPRLKEILGVVNRAETEYDNNMARRGFVYRILKAATNDKVSEQILNLAVELGVFIHKNRK